MNEVLNHFYHLEFTNNPYFLISKNWTPPPTYFAFPLYLAVETSVKNLFRYESEFDLSKKSSIWSLTWLTYFFTETSIVNNFPMYIVVQAPRLSSIFDWKFIEFRLYK